MDKPPATLHDNRLLLLKLLLLADRAGQPAAAG